MSDRRMFSKFVTDNDSFLDMPLSAQALYFHLGLSGDDEGFVASPRKVQRSVGASGDDLKLLIAKGFVIPFESGVMVITHWNIHNTLRKDRAKQTVFTEEREQLFLCDNGAYTLADNHLTTTCQPNDDQPTTNCPPNIIEANIIEEEENISKIEPRGSKPTRHKYGEYKNVLLSDEDIEKLKAEYPGIYEKYIEKLSEYMASTRKAYKNHLATLRNWIRKDNQEIKPASRPKQTEYRDFFDMLDKGEF